MSASNWAECPKCKEIGTDAIAEAGKYYGKVPQEQYEQMVAQLRVQQEMSVNEPTFREDWEIYGADKGVVCFSYSGHCSVCGLGMDFDFRRPLPGFEEASS